MTPAPQPQPQPQPQIQTQTPPVVVHGFDILQNAVLEIEFSGIYSFYLNS